MESRKRQGLWKLWVVYVLILHFAPLLPDTKAEEEVTETATKTAVKLSEILRNISRSMNPQPENSTTVAPKLLITRRADVNVANSSSISGEDLRRGPEVNRETPINVRRDSGVGEKEEEDAEDEDVPVSTTTRRSMSKISGIDQGGRRRPAELIRNALINHTLEHGGEQDLDKLVFSNLPNGSKLVLRTVKIIHTDGDGNPIDETESRQPTYWDVTVANATDLHEGDEDEDGEPDDDDDDEEEEDEEEETVDDEVEILGNATYGNETTIGRELTPAALISKERLINGESQKAEKIIGPKKKPDLESSGSHSAANYHHVGNYGSTGRGKEQEKTNFHGNTHGNSHKHTYTVTDGKDVKPYQGTEKGWTDYANDQGKNNKDQGERFKSSKRKNKGRKVTGFKRVYHKEEYQRTEHFYDDEEARKIAESFGLTDGKEGNNHGAKGDKRDYNGVRTDYLDGKKHENEYSKHNGYNKGQQTSHKNTEKHSHLNNYGKSQSQSHGSSPQHGHHGHDYQHSPHDHPSTPQHVDYHPNHNYHGSYSNPSKSTVVQEPKSIADQLQGTGGGPRSIAAIISAPMAHSFTVTEYAAPVEAVMSPDEPEPPESPLPTSFTSPELERENFTSAPPRKITNEGRFNEEPRYNDDGEAKDEPRYNHEDEAKDEPRYNGEEEPKDEPRYNEDDEPKEEPRYNSEDRYKAEPQYNDRGRLKAPPRFNNKGRFKDESRINDEPQFNDEEDGGGGGGGSGGRRKPTRKKPRERKMFYSPKHRVIEHDDTFDSEDDKLVRSLMTLAKTPTPVTHVQVASVADILSTRETLKKDNGPANGEMPTKFTPFAPNFGPATETPQYSIVPAKENTRETTSQFPKNWQWSRPRRQKRPRPPLPYYPLPVKTVSYPATMNQMHLAGIPFRHASAFHRLGNRHNQYQTLKHRPKVRQQYEVSTRKSDTVEYDNSTAPHSEDDSNHYFNHNHRYAKHHLTSTINPLKSNGHGVRNTLIDYGPGVYSTVIKVLPATMLNISDSTAQSNRREPHHLDGNPMKAAGRSSKVTPRPLTQADTISITTAYPHQQPLRPFLPKNRWLTFTLNLGNPDFKLGSEFGPSQHPFMHNSKRASYLMQGIKNGLLRPFTRPHASPSAIPLPTFQRPRMSLEYPRRPYNPQPVMLRRRPPNLHPIFAHNLVSYDNFGEKSSFPGEPPKVSSVNTDALGPSPPSLQISPSSPPVKNERPKFYYKPNQGENLTTTTTATTETVDGDPEEEEDDDAEEDEPDDKVADVKEDSNTESYSRRPTLKVSPTLTPVPTPTPSSTRRVSTALKLTAAPSEPESRKAEEESLQNPPFLNGIMDSVAGFFGRMG